MHPIWPCLNFCLGGSDLGIKLAEAHLCRDGEIRARLCRNREVRAKCQEGLGHPKLRSWNINVGIQSCHNEDFHSAAAIPEGGKSFLSCLLLFAPVSEQ